MFYVHKQKEHRHAQANQPAPGCGKCEAYKHDADAADAEPFFPFWALSEKPKNRERYPQHHGDGEIIGIVGFAAPRAKTRIEIVIHLPLARHVERIHRNGGKDEKYDAAQSLR